MDTKQHPADYSAWANVDFERRLRDKGPDNPFAVAVGSWVRQRAYSLWAVQELGALLTMHSVCLFGAAWLPTSAAHEAA